MKSSACATPLRSHHTHATHKQRMHRTVQTSRMIQRMFFNVKNSSGKSFIGCIRSNTNTRVPSGSRQVSRAGSTFGAPLLLPDPTPPPHLQHVANLARFRIGAYESRNSASSSASASSGSASHLTNTSFVDDSSRKCSTRFVLDGVDDLTTSAEIDRQRTQWCAFQQPPQHVPRSVGIGRPLGGSGREDAAGV
jgi:hypothetical protein